MRVHKHIGYNYFHSVQLFQKRAHDHVWNSRLYMQIIYVIWNFVAKPERDSAKHRYKLIECLQV